MSMANAKMNSKAIQLNAADAYSYSANAKISSVSISQRKADT